MHTFFRSVTSLSFTFLFVFLTSLFVLPLIGAQAEAAPVRTHGGVNGSQGHYYLRTENGGNGDLTPGQQVTVDSYFFQCRQAGNAPCSTEHNSDAVLIQPIRHDTVTVPNLNQQTQTFYHSYTPPYGNCGRVQFDQGIVGIPGAIGGWVHNFGVNCPDGPTPTPTPTPTPGVCNGQLPINTQFRRSGNNNTPWIDGNTITNNGLTPGSRIDVNCFAKNGTALLANARMDITLPNGTSSRGLQMSELRNYYLGEVGVYHFRCYIAGQGGICTDTDTLRVQAGSTPTPTPTSTPSPTPTAPPNHVSQCEQLSVVSGNDSLVPAKVTLRTRGSDNRGNIQLYRFYFGDGRQTETTNAEVQHTYEISGTFTARVDIKDSIGNWKTSNSCETTIRVQSTPIESHKSGCSDIFININNNAQAPATASFKVTGYDNKGDIQGYKLDFGNGIVKEGSGQTFEQLYEQAGTYTVRAYIKDSRGNYQGNEESCKRTVYINTKPLTRQPETGTPTLFTVLGIVSGAGGVALSLAKKKLVA